MYINDSKNYEDLVKAFYYHGTPDPNFPTKHYDPTDEIDALVGGKS